MLAIQIVVLFLLNLTIMDNVLYAALISLIAKHVKINLYVMLVILVKYIIIIQKII